MPASRLETFPSSTEQGCAESCSARDRRCCGSKLSTSSLEEVIGADPEVDDSVDVPDGGSHVAGTPSPRAACWQATADRFRPVLFCRRTALCLVATFMVVTAYHLFVSYLSAQADIALDAAQLVEFPRPMPGLPDKYYDRTKELDPDQWIRQNSFLDPALIPTQRLYYIQATRPKAALIALVHNSEVGDMVHSITQVEARFNSRELHHYDWVFFNDEDFSETFKAAITNATSSRCFFERIPQEHWSVPSWIDKSRFDAARKIPGDNGVGKAWHHMCRWNSGLFALEERLQQYKWFWRVEPGADYACDIEYDVFKFMQDNDMVYGFNMAILDDARSFPSLWEKTKAFQYVHNRLVHKEANMDWALHRSKDPDSLIRAATMGHDTPATATGENEVYNHCQFYSNFEIGSLDFFRGRAHQAYFHHLDKSGGFYYERFCDAPVHTLSVSMFLPKRQVWYFRDIGHSHDLCENCPTHSEKLAVDPESDPKKMRIAELEACLKESQNTLRIHQRNFEKESKAPSLQSGCTIGGLDRDNSRLVQCESMQKRPDDTCIRMWLRAKWPLKKRELPREDRKSLGGSGSPGSPPDNHKGNWFDARLFTSQDDPEDEKPNWGSRVDNGNAPTICTAFSLIMLSLMATLHFLL